MKVVFHEDFRLSYTSDPAAESGRMESVERVIRDWMTESATLKPRLAGGDQRCNPKQRSSLPGSPALWAESFTWVQAVPATEEEIAAVHTRTHMERVRREGVYDIAALAAGGAIQTAAIGLAEPCFGLIRPPGHHASAESSWGFCYFNNMAIALEKLHRDGEIENALVLDFDLHFGDGTVNILEGRGYATILNPTAADRNAYLREVYHFLMDKKVDIIGVSAGFDHHVEDWGGLLTTADYQEMGRMVREAARNNDGGCFGLLEGGYNHRVLGGNVLAFLEGLETG